MDENLKVKELRRKELELQTRQKAAEDLHEYLADFGETFSRNFSDDIYTQIMGGAIDEESEELIELFSYLAVDPIGNRFLSFLLGMDPESWIQEMVARVKEDQDEEEE